MTIEEKRAKVQALKWAIEYLRVYVSKAETTDDILNKTGITDDIIDGIDLVGNEIVAVAEILLEKAYDLYPDIPRAFE